MWGNIFEGVFIAFAAIVLKYSRDWKVTLIFPLAVSILVFFVFIWYSVESPEFLFQNEKYDKLEASLNHIAKKNGCGDEEKVK